MATKIYYDDDADLDLLRPKKIAIIGYGAQGAAHAQNLRDSGCQVLIGQRPGGAGYRRAVNDGFSPISISDAAQADLVNLLIPDEVHGEVFRDQILSQMKPGDVVMTCHGFSFHYGLVKPPPGVDALLVAPKGQGHMVRGEFLKGGGVPCLVATGEGSNQTTFQLGLAYAKALGGTRAGVIHTTIAAETETDLFGEQAVLCGGVSALVQAGFETLVQAGYQPELAYFECLHELKIIVDLLYRGGLAEMRDVISTTAEYGDYTRGPRVIDHHVRQSMQNILAEIQSGEFARQFIEQHQQGDLQLQSFRQSNRDLVIEQVGRKLRGMMPWLNR
jgi:ketol-acid reductoisomerase